MKYEIINFHIIRKQVDITQIDTINEYKHVLTAVLVSVIIILSISYSLVAIKVHVNKYYHI